jgi:hypothetical protein
MREGVPVFETIGCTLATLRRLKHVWYDERPRRDHARAVVALGDAVKDQRKDRRMKIYSIEVETDLGRRVVQPSPPLDVEPLGDMPSHFRSLTEVLWSVLREVAIQAPALAAAAPKAEA